MNQVFARPRNALGMTAISALLLLGAAAAFHAGVVRPLESHATTIERRVADAARRVPRDGLLRVGNESAAAKIAAFYGFFERGVDTTEWLAMLQHKAGAAGLDLRSGEYRLIASQQRLQRYQVTLPVTGSYAQIRAFLMEALDDIPVLSLDQLAFRRRNASDGRVEAEILLTLHLVRR